MDVDDRPALPIDPDRTAGARRCRAGAVSMRSGGWLRRSLARSLAVAALAVTLPHGDGWAFKVLRTGANAIPHWEQPELRYRVTYDVAPPEPAASQQGAPLGPRIQGSMQPWSAVTCPEGGQAKPMGVTFVQTDAPEVATCPGDGDGMRRCLGGDGVVRVIADAAEWPLSDLTVGYTLLASDAGSGVATRFALLLNDATFDFCDFDCDGKAFDIGSVLLHEAGHVLGLDHTDVQTAVMAASRSAAEILRKLHVDDREGLCSIYPIAPATGDDGGCNAQRSATSNGSAPARHLALAALAVVALTAFARRRGRGQGARAAALALAALTFAYSAEAGAWTAAKAPSGADQRWYVETIGYDLDRTGLGAQGLSDAAVATATAAAFAAWTAVDCALCVNPRGAACPPVPCASQPLGLKVRFDGWASPRSPGLGCVIAGDTCHGQPDGNQVLFVHDPSRWPAASHVIALTLLAADVTTGAIGDADILLNAAVKTFCRHPDCGVAGYDLQNTLTHEVGHLLGLDHSATFEATMYGGAPPQETHKRDLHGDDLLGVCSLYRSAFSPAGCAVPVAPGDHGCVAHTVAGAPSPGSRLALLALSVALLALQRGSVTASDAV